MKTAIKDAPRPARVHSFALPRLDASIPTALEQTTETSRWIARLALAAEKEGLSLPGGNLESASDILAHQFTAFATATYPGVGRNARAVPAFEFMEPEYPGDRFTLTVFLRARAEIEVYLLKPVVEALEAECKGLGWYVRNVINDSARHGLECYDEAIVGYAGSYMFHDMAEFSDRAMVIAYLDQGGDVDVADPEKPTQAEIDAVAEQVAMMPSRVLETVDGHEHLLGFCGPKQKPRPKPASETAVKKWLKGAGRKHDLHRCVELAQSLNTLFKQDKDCNFSYQLDDEAARIGGMGFVVWKDSNYAREAAEHYEQDVYESSSADECVGAMRICLNEETTEDDLRTLVRAVKQQLEMWSVLDELLGYLPTEE